MTEASSQPVSSAPSPAGPSVVPVIDAVGVRKTYMLGKTPVPVLRGVDISAGRGEWVAVLGASGSGKSTLLHLLGGLDTPDRAKDGVPASRISFQGTELASMSSSELDAYRAGSVGFVFQSYHLLPELSVLQNVTIAAMIRHGRLGYRRERPQLRDRARELLEVVGLSHRLKHKPVELSGGERQRVAIARSLINHPTLLLADEPTGNLDRKTGAGVLDSLVALRESLGQTVIMVTHDPEIAKLADRTIMLTDGLVVPDGAQDGPQNGAR